MLIIGPWYFQSEYAVLFDSYSVPATLIQTGVLKCYCPGTLTISIELYFQAFKLMIYTKKKKVGLDVEFCSINFDTKFINIKVLVSFICWKQSLRNKVSMNLRLLHLSYKYKDFKSTVNAEYEHMLQSKRY